MTTFLFIGLALIAAYVGFVAVRFGFHQRLPLVFSPISLERIPDCAARKHGDKALFTTDRPVGWDIPALRNRYPNPYVWSAARIKSYAGYLATLFWGRFGVRHGDRIAILKTNHLDIHIFTTAIVRAGGIACPINGKFDAGKLSPYLLNIGARILITDAKTLRRVIEENGDFGRIEIIVLAQRRSESGIVSVPPGREVVWIEEALEDVTFETSAVSRGKDEPLYLVHSSGTTGFPKSVILKNGPQSHALRGWLCYVPASRRLDKGYLAVPNNHQAVILSFNSLLLLGLRTHWIGPYDRDGFDAENVVGELANGRYTGFFGFPATYSQLKEVDFGRFDLRRMQFWAATADASHEVVERQCVSVGSTFRRLGIPVAGSIFLDAQGSSEVGTPSVIRYVTPFTRRFGRRIGQPGSTPFGPKIRVVRSDGKIAQRGEAGRLMVKGKTIFDGYWNHHDLTYRAMHDGWFFTGDVVRCGRDGHLIQLDREVDVIRTRNGDVYSLPMEERIHKHRAVFDACVYGAQQDDGSQRPATAIALRDGFVVSEEQLVIELNEMLSHDEQLCALEIMAWADFPMGVTGKTLKRVFRERTERGEIKEMNRPVVLENE